jgi:hypothetical protein
LTRRLVRARMQLVKIEWRTDRPNELVRTERLLAMTSVAAQVVGTNPPSFELQAR